MKEDSPQPGTSSSYVPSPENRIPDDLELKTEKEEIDQLQLPEEEKPKDPPTPAEVDDRIPKINFLCEICGMDEMVHYKGTVPPFVSGISLLEDSYVMRDPFQPHPPRWRRKPEYFIILGAHCCICDKVVCRDVECSFYYVSTFCLSCAKRAVQGFPLEVQTKLRKQLANTQGD